MQEILDSLSKYWSSFIGQVMESHNENVFQTYESENDITMSTLLK